MMESTMDITAIDMQPQRGAKIACGTQLQLRCGKRFESTDVRLCLAPQQRELWRVAALPQRDEVCDISFEDVDALLPCAHRARFEPN